MSLPSFQLSAPVSSGAHGGTINNGSVAFPFTSPAGNQGMMLWIAAGVVAYMIIRK